MGLRFKKILLFLGDAAFLHLALLLTLVLRYGADWPRRWSSHWPHFLVIFLLWLTILYINDMYNLNLRVRERKFFRAALNSAILSSLLSILYFYLNVQSSIAPRTNLAIFIGLFILLFFVWRLLYQALVRPLVPKNNLALIGFNRHGQELLKELAKNPGAGYQATLIFHTPDELTNLATSLKEKDIHTIVVADDFGQSDKLRQALFECLAQQVTFFNYPDFYELITGKIPVEAIGPNWFLENLREGEKNYFNFSKRLADFFLALLILLVSLPGWPLIALITRLTSRGPVLFYQTRLGKNGRSFRIIKFRTMRVDDNDASPTAEDDRRVTSFGSFLRKTRLDEIPQTINILRGEMSFIGPRPERPEIAAELEKQIPFYKTRLLAKPGLTGWDQISGDYHSPSPTDSLLKLQYDLFYLKQRSFYLDLTIALKTIATVLSRAGR